MINSKIFLYLGASENVFVYKYIGLNVLVKGFYKFINRIYRFRKLFL